MDLFNEDDQLWSDNLCWMFHLCHQPQLLGRETGGGVVNFQTYLLKPLRDTKYFVVWFVEILGSQSKNPLPEISAGSRHDVVRHSDYK